ncbi:MAG: ArsA-related P-loop ATPase [Thermodesulfobacteriota bacterium]
MSIDALLKEKKIIVCCGAGGVGKTTVSSALALRAAQAGRKVLVCTIDPAKRLADSLGLQSLGNTETRIGQDVLDKAGLSISGELWAMMLDSKTTFDDLIRRIAPAPETAERILKNAFYQNITTALAGSQEFSATEKLYELSTKNVYDLIVLDTPPSRHALDFLDAPNRLKAFLDASVIQWMVKPYLAAGRMGFRFINSSAKLAFRILEKATGYQTLADIADFFLVFEGLYDGFAARATKVRDLMGHTDTAFVLVTTPQSPALLDAQYFLTRLTEEGMPLGEVIFNRVSVNSDHMTSEDVQEAAEKAAAKLPDHAEIILALAKNLRLTILLAEADRRSINRFLSRAREGVGNARVPFLRSDVHDLNGLSTIASFLTGEEE